MTSCKGLNTPH
ncbi:hypothetical protein F383_04199 [Gossypium arboreum]|uniref:Uncharacterized protein n=1 Tax=Gossypium arboreum TaxID=29729 RepID=A0A0B0PAQ8_GOSAR|nr:hypothetical protein F383_04199 [Gossypium arboreum]